MFYREGMSGVVILLGMLAVVLFVVDIRFNDIVVGTDGSLGFLIAMGIVILIQLVYAFVFTKEKQTGTYIFGGTLLVAAAAYFLNDFFNIKINYDYAAIAIVALSAVYWAFLILYHRAKKYWSIVFVAIASIIFCFSADYIFEKVLEPHQQIRIKVLLNMEEDLTGAGYNVNQSKIAIGSGGFLGKGFLNGTQTKLKYVPEQDTDFIFCTVGEEHGFVGSVVVLGLFVFLLLRLLKISERQKDIFSRVYGYCVTSILFFHLTVNVGMVLGIMPVIGIPLPFFSYGGSSLWGFTILLFILIKLDSNRLERA
jgi:rod shape determining protein RodA